MSTEQLREEFERAFRAKYEPLLPKGGVDKLLRWSHTWETYSNEHTELKFSGFKLAVSQPKGDAIEVANEIYRSLVELVKEPYGFSVRVRQGFSCDDIAKLIQAYAEQYAARDERVRENSESRLRSILSEMTLHVGKGGSGRRYILTRWNDVVAEVKDAPTLLEAIREFAALASNKGGE